MHYNIKNEKIKLQEILPLIYSFPNACHFKSIPRRKANPTAAYFFHFIIQGLINGEILLLKNC